MTEFQDYMVELTLQDSTKVSGTITNVVDKTLTLSDVLFASTGEQLAQLQVIGNEISDLKVIYVPAELIKGKSKKQKSKKENKHVQHTPDLQIASPVAEKVPEKVAAQLLDDAIIFASSASEISQGKLQQNQLVKEVVDSNVYPPNRSSTNTPKLRKAPKSASGKRIHSSDPDWGTNDITEIKKSNDFDFERNLALFDKQSVFEELKAHDSVAPSNRLVGHNKSDSPAKTKYNNDEMVLESTKDAWDNLDDDGQLKTPKPKVKSSKKSNSKDLPTQLDLRKLSQSGMSPLGVNFQFTSNNEPIPLCSPVNLLEIERTCQETYGLTPSILSENASRGISQLVLQALGGFSRVSSKNHNTPPLVLILAGNNRAGSRALATGRQLSNHGVRCMSFILCENEDELDEQVKFQSKLFKNCGGKVFKSLTSLNSSLKNLDSPIEIAIDALQGYDSNLYDLWGEESNTAIELVEWCNKKQISIMSLDIPSGVDSGSGQVHNFRLKMNSKWVVSMGLPLNGLSHAYNMGLLTRSDSIHYLVDIGIPSRVFTKGTLRKFNRTWFTSDWVSLLEVKELNAEA